MKYKISVIDNFGGFGSNGWAVNEEGTAVGEATTGAGKRHAMQLKNNQMTDLTPDDQISVSVAYGINNLAQAQVVGTYRKTGGNTKAFVWNNGVFTDLNALFKGVYSIAEDINDDGQIVGTRGVNSAQAILFNLNTQTIIVPAPAATLSFGQGINNHGHMVGRSATPTQGFLYNDMLHMLPTLGGNATDPTDINDLNLIVGASMISGTNDWHAFALDSNGMHDLHAMNGHYSKAWAVNNHQVIVGEVNDSENLIAFIREPGGQMISLHTMLNNPAGWERLTRATDINDDGVITGSGIFQGEYRGFVLVPVKENKLEKLHDLPLLVAEILFGVGTGGGGLIVVGGKIIPIDPPVPFREITSLQKRALASLISEQLFVRPRDSQIEKMVHDVYNEGVKNHKAFNKILVH